MISFGIRLKFNIMNILFNMKILRKLPDDTFLKIRYKLRMGKKLDLNNPQTFNEKLQWLKINDHNPLYTAMADKYEAKEYIKKRCGESYCIPTLGVWEKFDDIDFDSLPTEFILKTTHDSGSFIICEDKSTINMKKAKRKLERSLKRNYYWKGREWPYKDIHPRIIAEELLHQEGQERVTDYKFFCFNGEPQFYYITMGATHTKSVAIQYFDMKNRLLPIANENYAHYEGKIEIPEEIEEMKVLAGKLSAGVPFLRVDFYLIDKKIYVSELTFFPYCGMEKYYPEGTDEEIGKLLKL